jgi:HEAT repeat protein
MFKSGKAGGRKKPPDWERVERILRCCWDERDHGVFPGMSAEAVARGLKDGLDRYLEGWRFQHGVLVWGMSRVRKIAITVSGASPGQAEFERDLVAMLHDLEAWARSGELPGYLPRRADVDALSQSVRVRQGVRLGLADESEEGTPGLPSERSISSESPKPWAEIAAANRQLIVLADPGFGKSWLIRSETRRVCREMLDRLAQSGPADVLIPVPLRCDQLIEAPGQGLPDKAAACLSTQGLLPDRSRAHLAEQVRRGKAVLLLDALDELTEAQSGLLRACIRAWADHARDQARFVITSRLAGYTGSPVPGACEVEILAFTADDIEAMINAWNLPPAKWAQLVNRMSDPAIAAMARIPLLLALMCSLSSSPDGEELPGTRGRLLDRVLRWFLTRTHRSPDAVTAPMLDDIGVDALMEFLGHLAFAFANHPDGWTDLMSGDRLLKEIRAARTPFSEFGRTPAEVLRELAVRAGILVPAGNPSGGRSPGYLFFHRTVSEYLVACHLSTLSEREWMTIIEEHRWFDPDWAGVIPMLGERISPSAARNLIEHLAGADPDPFWHSMTAAIRVWGSRPDSDQLTVTDKLGQRLDAFVHHQIVLAAATPHLATLAYLPQVLLCRITVLASEPIGSARLASAKLLAGRQGPGIAEALIELLADPDFEVRWTAADALAGHKDPGVTQSLTELLTHPDAGIREMAVMNLADRDAIEVTRALLDLINDPAYNVRQALSAALAGRAGIDVTRALLGLLDDPDFEVRRSTVEVLAGRDGEDVTNALLDGLTLSGSGIQHESAKALARRQVPGLIEYLLNLLTNTDPHERVRAAKALEGWEGPGVARALVPLLTDPDMFVRIAAESAMYGREYQGMTQDLLNLLSDPDRSASHAAVTVLSRSKEPVVTQALLDLLCDPDWSVRKAAAVAIAHRQGPHLAEELLALLARPDVTTKPEMVKALASCEGSDATQILVRLLTHPDADVSREALNAAESREGENVTNALLALLTHPDMRSGAARALASREGEAVTQALLDLCIDPDLAVRHAAVTGLAGREGETVTQALLDLCTDPDSAVRFAALSGVMAREGEKVAQALVSLLTHPDQDVRHGAARALVNREGENITQALLSLRTDPDSLVRQQALVALAGRREPYGTHALLSLLADPNPDIRARAAVALADRAGHGITQALMDLLRDPRWRVRQTAAAVLRHRNAARELLTWVMENPDPDQIDMALVMRIEEEMATRAYHRSGSSEKKNLQVAIARLTDFTFRHSQIDARRWEPNAIDFGLNP